MAKRMIDVDQQRTVDPKNDQYILTDQASPLDVNLKLLFSGSNLVSVGIITSMNNHLHHNVCDANIHWLSQSVGVD